MFTTIQVYNELRTNRGSNTWAMYSHSSFSLLPTAVQDCGFCTAPSASHPCPASAVPLTYCELLTVSVCPLPDVVYTPEMTSTAVVCSSGS